MSAIAQIVFYALIVPITLYVGIRAWKYGPRMAWYPVMAFACVRLTGGGLVLASQADPKNISLITAAIVLLNLGFIPLTMSFHALMRMVLESTFPESKKMKIFAVVTRLLLLGAIGLLITSGSLRGQSDMAGTQSTLSRIAYFELVVVLLALLGMAVWLNFWNCHKIQDGQIIYIQWALISSPLLFVRAVFGVISVFEAAGNNMFTSIWSPLFGSALLFSLMALLPEYVVLCIFVYLGFHRFSTADRYGLVAQKGMFKRKDDMKTSQDQTRGSTDMA